MVVQQGLHPDILHVHVGRRVEEHIAEQTGKAHEILILDPAAGAPTHHLAAELVFAGNEVGRQLEVAGRERIGREADVVAVEPDDDAALRALEGDEHAPAGKALRQKEMLAVAGDGVEIPGDFADLDILPAVPGVLHVAVLRHAVALHLDVGGDGDVRPAAAVVVGRFKAVDGLAEIQCVVELPQAVQGEAQAGFACGPFRARGVGNVVRVCRNAVFGEVRGRLELAVIKCHNEDLAVRICCIVHSTDRKNSPAKAGENEDFVRQIILPVT